MATAPLTSQFSFLFTSVKTKENGNIKASCRGRQAAVYLYRALPASTAIQSMAKSICLTKGDMRTATVWAALSTTLGCSRMILQGAAQSTQIIFKKTSKTSSHSHSRAPNFSQGTFLSYRRFEEDRVAHEMLMSSTSSSNEPLCFSLMSLIIWKNLEKSRNLQKTTRVAVCSVTNCCLLTSETR